MKQKLRIFLTLLLCAVASVGWADSWVKTDATSLQTGDVIVIVDQESTRAMSNNNGTSSAPSATSITLSGDKSEITSTISDALQWVVTVDNETYKFGKNGTSNYLYCTNTNNGVRVGTNDNNTFTIHEGRWLKCSVYTNGKYVTRYVGVYNNQDWRCYENTTGNISKTQTVFYKKVSDTAPSVVAPTFSPVDGSTFGDDGLEVTISQADNKTIYYTLDGSDPDNTSTQYTAPFTINATTTVKAIAYDGTDASTIAMATYTYVDPNAPGTQNNPYTVAQAREAIDAGSGTQGVYATGKVSAIPTAWSSEHENITFNFVDNSGDEVFLQAYRCASGDDADASQVAVGDIVVVYGNLTKYGSTYEFGQGCTLVSLTHPTTPTVTVSPTSLAGFTYEEEGGPSATKTISVSGANLTEAINLVLDDNSKFEMSLTEGSDYANNLTLSLTDGSVANTTVYVRLKDGLETGEYTGTITLSSTGAANVTVNLSGSVTAPEAQNVTWDLTKASYDAEPTEELVTWSSDYATMTLEKGTSSTNANNYLGGTNTNSHTRLYLNQKLSISPVTGYRVSSVVITATSSSYAKGFTGNSWTNATASTSGTTISVTPTNGKNAVSIIISEACRATAVKVFYEPDNTPAISVDPPSIDAAYEETRGTLTVTYDNINDNSTASIFFCNANGEAATYDWIEVNFDNDKNISYHINANTNPDAARTAYLKVKVDDVYSNLVTITQAKFVRDYAILPFSYDGNGSGTLPVGLTQSGIGTYSSSPAMKFDAEGDNLVLKMNEAPKTLIFDIKGNGFSGGTFKVQTSSDGRNYTDLATYDELTSDVQTESITITDTDVRYIKWIYIKKENGNVALGNIIAANASIPEAPTFDLPSGTYPAGTVVTITPPADPKMNVTVTYSFVDGSDTWSETGANNQSKTRTLTKDIAITAKTSYKYDESMPPLYSEEVTNTYTIETIPVTISSVGISTLYYGTKNLIVPEGVDVYAVTVNSSPKLSRAWTYRAGDVLPAGTGVVLEAPQGTYNFKVTTETDLLPASNMLKGSDEAEETTGGTYYYALTLDKNHENPGFYWMNETGAAFMNGAHKAYMALDRKFSAIVGAKSFLALPGDDDTDGIGQIEMGQTNNAEIYNLSGQRVNKAQKGIYIVNGKKVVVK